MNKQPTIVIVGTGNLAWHLCNAFKASKLNLIGIASRNLQESEKFATEFELKSYPIDNIPNSDIVIIAVKDTTIHEVSSALKINCNTIIAHTSGAASMEQIDDKFENKGVFYPFQTFTKKRELAYQNIPIFTESSNSETKKILGYLANAFSGKTNELNSEKRKSLHLAGVLSNNFTNVLILEAIKQLEEQKIPRAVLWPLLSETIQKAIDINPENAQTGPAIRNDEQIINQHLVQLKNKPKLQTIYQELTDLIQKDFLNTKS